MTASTAKTSSLPSLTTLYAGDDHITLHVKRENGPIICRCKVSKLIMCIASPVWRAMLGGRFMEGNVQNREIPLIDDDPEALLTVLRIAHHRTYEVPTGLTLLQLVNIATICDKYDTVAMCRPYIGIWVTPFIEIVEPSHQALYLSPGYESWLWCAWVFGYQETFSKLVNKLRVEISTDKEGCCYIPSDWEPNQLKLLKANMPSDLTETLLHVRYETIQAMLGIFYGYLDRVQSGYSCRAYPSTQSGSSRLPSTNQNAVCCSALTLGLLIPVVQTLGGCCSPFDATTVHHSVDIVYQILTNVKLHEWREVDHWGPRRSHGQCDFTSEMQRHLFLAYQAIKSPVLSSYVAHMERQWAKGNYEA